MNDNEPKGGMSLVMQVVAHWLKAFLLIFGMYIVLYGHLTPGGGFPGGVIVACAFILITLAHGEKVARKTLSKTVASELDSVGALLFLLLGLAGLVWAGGFLKNFIRTGEPFHFELFSGGIIPLCNIGIGLKVGASLSMVFIILASLRVVTRDDGERRMVQRRREGQ